MNQDTLINKLLQLDVIKRSYRRGYYYIRGEGYTRRKRDYIIGKFAAETAPYRYCILMPVVEAAQSCSWSAATFTDSPVIRTLSRNTYHSDRRQLGQRDFVEEALANIAPDEDGIKRSFGIEYEIYALTPEQEDKLARLLDTMPKHIVERDGSLAGSGAEIVFAPVDAATFISTVKKLADFVRENNVAMKSEWGTAMAGMHTTYGVSNSTATRSDLQIRLNRMALAVKSAATRDAIRRLFGRDFGHYRELPGQTSDENALAYNSHRNAFSINGRPTSCWENRLLAWNCDSEKIVEFFKATEFVFNRPVKASDFMKVFEILGSNADEE